MQKLKQAISREWSLVNDRPINEYEKRALNNYYKRVLKNISELEGIKQELGV